MTVDDVIKVVAKESGSINYMIGDTSSTSTSSNICSHIKINRHNVSRIIALSDRIILEGCSYERNDFTIFMSKHKNEEVL